VARPYRGEELGSIIEQTKIVGPLTDPLTYGGRAEDAFDVVIPSFPKNVVDLG
jgi:hypothetical protein